MTDEEAWQLVLENERLVKKAVDRFAKRHPSRSFDELISAGYIGAFQATKTWDPAKGKLSTRMWHGAWWAVDKAWKTEDARPQGYFKQQEDGSRRFTKVILLDDPRARGHFTRTATGGENLNSPEPDQHEDPAAEFETELISRLDAEIEAERYFDEIDTWTDRNQDIFFQRVFEEQTLSDIAELHGLTRERINQIVKEGLNKLRKLGVGADDTAVKAPAPLPSEAVA